MAGLRLAVNSGEYTLVASTARTVLQIKAPAQQRLVIENLRMFGKMAAGGTDPVVKVRLTRSTSAFGSGGASLTPAKLNPSNPETVQSTALGGLTTEPTSPTDGGLFWYFNPQTGILEPGQPDQKIEVPGGQSANFEATSTGTPILSFGATYDE